MYCMRVAFEKCLILLKREENDGMQVGAFDKFAEFEYNGRRFRVDYTVARSVSFVRKVRAPQSRTPDNVR